MCSLKFVVYFLIILQTNVERPVFGSAIHWNGSANDKFDVLTEIYSTINLQRLARNVRNVIKGMAEVPMEAPYGQAQDDASFSNALGRKIYGFQRNSNLRQRSNNDRESDNDFNFLVTGGYRPEKNDLVKYVVSLRTKETHKYFGDNHFCGGSIISKRAVLTAAHCLFSGNSKHRPNNLRVIAGSPRRLLETSNTQEHKISKVTPHPKYSLRRVTYDIGILKLKRDMATDADFVDIIPIANTDPSAETQCTVVGWGTIIENGPVPDEAVNGDMSIRSNSFCSKLKHFQSGMLCASNAADYEVDSCQGDSGGPLICDGKVAGIVSFGIGCGRPDSAGIYTDVYHFRKWVEKNVAACQFTCCSKLLLIALTIQVWHSNI